MKILFVANKLWDVFIFRGGIIKSLVEDGHKIKIVAPDDGRVDTGEILGAESIDIQVDKRGVNPLRDMLLFFQLLKIYRKERPELIYHYTIKLNIYGTLAARILGIKSIAVLTGLGYSFVQEGLVSKIAKALYKFSLKGAQEVWVLNSDDRDYLLREGIAPKEKLFILPGEGVNTEKYKALPRERGDKEMIFLMVARAFFDKGFREYEEAARIIQKEYPQVKFQFLGALGEGSRGGVDGKYMDKLVLEGTMEYLGITDDVPSVVKEADCVVLPSYREGISMVLLEAASMEKPIIATNVTGCREIVEDGITGFLVEPRSSESLAEAMKKFLKLNSSEKKIMGRKGREKVIDEFDERIIIEIYKKKVGKYGA
ncbi:MAG: glycosyltransferase family 4 protein [Fusobacteriaceae bacterium]